MGSRAWLMKFLRDLRASYWFLPVVLVIVSQFLAGVILWIDRSLPVLVQHLLPGVLADTQAEGARTLLSLMASSVIGVAGVMFSLTMVAVSFASGNFGPRLVGNFMRDRGNQLSLGAMIATFTFCLQILRAVKSPAEGEQFVPHLALTTAVGLMLVSVLVMIYFIHHIPETIDVGNISAGLGRRLEIVVRREIDRHEKDEEAGQGAVAPSGRPLARPAMARSGYVQSMDFGRLSELEERHGWRLQLLAQPGDFVSAETPVLDVYPGHSDTAPTAAEQDSLCACFALGDNRTEDQSPLFLSDQLVEITARALSPGINDPFTACDCLNRMYAALHLALSHKRGLNPNETGALGQRQLTFAALLESSFTMALPYVAKDPMARDHMAGLILRLRPAARTTADARALDTLSDRLNAGAPD
ncbi:DUF2254 domain-containing protein [Tropicimonas sp. IMCC34043]|uniref:DUF2254 domain-containing protein n=1 Tax=Tropicimonas sp. IMCC34043 TaxID=2248760 RepID=UPI0013009C0D|nr:DUF2254 domain-containing protein [Tropicimonas sp. IMCC34043]